MVNWQIVSDLIDEVSRDSPALEGSVATLSGSLGVALAVMVANLCTSKAGFEQKKELSKIAEDGQKLKNS